MALTPPRKTANVGHGPLFSIEALLARLYIRFSKPFQAATKTFAAHPPASCSRAVRRVSTSSSSANFAVEIDGPQEGVVRLHSDRSGLGRP